MKSFICLLLLAFIACDVAEKKDEIVLKDFGEEFFEQLANIIANCGEENTECISGQVADLVSGMSYEQQMEYSQLVLSQECKGICVDAFSDKVSEYFTDLYCTSFCPYSM